MCGTCGSYFEKDWSWPLLVGRRSATLVAKAAERLSQIHGTRVLTTPSGWQVLMPTGATHLVHSLSELTLIAKVDHTLAPEVRFADSDQELIIDRRRAITPRAALDGEPPSSASSSWPACLLNENFTVAIIDGPSPDRFHHNLRELARISTQAQYRDHIRLLPFAGYGELTFLSGQWPNLPNEIGFADLPALCVSIAAHIGALDETDGEFREAKIHWGTLGILQLQSVGSTITSLEILTE